MTASSTVVVDTRGLTKRFRQVTAVDHLNLTVHQGDVVALLGSNGSGKSTTFRLLLNIYPPSSGTAEVLGHPTRSLDGRNYDKIAFISESQKIPQWMTVRDYLDYCSQFYSEWDDAFCTRLLNSFQLDTRPKIKHLSRGQKMKVAVASVLPAHPQLLLLDEPFSGLDVETRDQLGKLLKSLGSERKLTTILTTHDVEEVEPVASRLVLLKGGKSVIDEPLTAFLERHRRLSFATPPGTPLPDNLLDTLRRESQENGSTSYVIQNYSPTLETRLRESLPPDTQPTFTPLPLRAILTARAIQW